MKLPSSRRARLLPFAGLVLGASAHAQITVDGTIAGDAYGGALGIQSVETGFGDNFSELDAVYGAIYGGRLHLALTGNLENNFNKLEVFIDSVPGGENVLSGTPGNDNAFNMTGLRFDAGFGADYHLILRRGFSGVSRFDVDFSQIGTGNYSSYGDVFGGSDTGAGATGVGINASPILVAYDGSNVAGVLGGSAIADFSAALAVQTGTELGISLADLGSPSGAIRVCAFVNNQDHNYASNQFLGGVPAPQGNLGSDGNGTFTGVCNFDLNNFAGDQYVTVAMPALGIAYCNGNGSGTACPCGNDNDGSAGVAGCALASGPNCNNPGGGVTLRGTGTRSVSLDDAVLHVTGAQSGQPGLFFRADQSVLGGNGQVFGDGLRCAGGTVVRLQITAADATGDAQTSVSLSAGLVPGDVRRFQYWCRVPGCTPCGAGFTTSNGYVVVFEP
ncbi:MAG: hypothetical protein H6828_06970 [Planctomycetes bacterium]|nr:hypothetical protein [Planctomycetota bacterium]